MADELKRCAILGTAPSWKWCPWQDKSLQILGLNDAWVLGYPRADMWFDLHPPSHWMLYDRAKPPTWDQVPVGTYLRPQEHRQWLKSQIIPVFLHEARTDWPTSVTFPREAVLDFWRPYWPYRIDRKGVISDGKDYELSSPAWMYMWAVMEGYCEIHIYGIHLSTEWEYVRQRPNLEFLMGVGAGLGVKHILPESAPICRASFRYGYEPKPDVIMEPTQRRIDALKLEKHQIGKAMQAMKWHERGRKADLASRLAQVELELTDAHNTLAQLRAKVA